MPQTLPLHRRLGLLRRSIVSCHCLVERQLSRFDEVVSVGCIHSEHRGSGMSRRNEPPKAAGFQKPETSFKFEVRVHLINAGQTPGYKVGYKAHTDSPDLGFSNNATMLSAKYRFRNSPGVCPDSLAYFATAAAFSGVSSIFIVRGECARF